MSTREISGLIDLRQELRSLYEENAALRQRIEMAHMDGRLQGIQEAIDLTFSYSGSCALRQRLQVLEAERGRRLARIEASPAECT